MPHNNINAPAPRPEVLTRPKLEGGRRFVMRTDFTAAGDQPTAIAELTLGVQTGEHDQVLLGAGVGELGASGERQAQIVARTGDRRDNRYAGPAGGRGWARAAEEGGYRQQLQCAVEQIKQG